MSQYALVSVAKVLAIWGFVSLAAVPGQAQLAVMAGTGANDLFGTRIANLGDLNADGWPDFAISATQAPGTILYPPPIMNGQPSSVGPGRVEIFSGAAGLPTLNTLFGPPTTSGFGASISRLGDVDGNGLPDFAIGAPLVITQGRVFVYSGVVSPIQLYALQAPLASVGWSTGSGMLYGWDIAALGDIDGDGRGEIIVGAPGGPAGFALEPASACFVHSGATGGFLGWAPASGFNVYASGYSIATGEDLDNDGVDDFASGDPVDSYTMAYSGASASAGITPMSQITSAIHSTFIGTGYDMEFYRDVNGDGVVDIVSGAPLSNVNGLQTGTVHVLSGTDLSIIQQLHGQSIEARFGYSVACDGDFDGDGVFDIAVGAPEVPAVVGSCVGSCAIAGPGFVEVYSGSSLHLLARFDGAATGDGFGYTVEYVGDLNADGSDELAIGAPFATVGTLQNAGRAYIYEGLRSLPCAAGNVPGSPFVMPLLLINGSAGDGNGRRVPVGINQPVVFTLAQPPATVAPAAFVLFGAFGVFGASTVFPTAIGDLCFTPVAAQRANQNLFMVSNSLWSDSIAILPPSMTPWSFSLSGGVPFPTFGSFQAIVTDSSGLSPLGFSVSNAVVLDVQ